MYDALLQELGLSPNEARIYEALITYGGSPVSTVSLRASVHRRNAYDALKRLLEKGLVFEVQGRSDVTYEAVDPGKLQELLREKEMKLNAVMPKLEKLYHGKLAPERTYLFKGVEGIKNEMREILKTGEDLYTLGAEGAWLDPRLASYTRWFLDEAKDKGIKINALLDDDARDVPGLTSMLKKGYKFLPEKYDTEGTIDIFGDYVVTYTGTSPGALSDDCTIFVMSSPRLAECYRTWWKMMWDMLPEEKKRR